MIAHVNHSTAEVGIPGQHNLYLSTGCYISRDSDFQRSRAPNLKPHSYQRQLLSPKKLSCNTAPESYFAGLFLLMLTNQAAAQSTAGQDQPLG